MTNQKTVLKIHHPMEIVNVCDMLDGDVVYYIVPRGRDDTHGPFMVVGPKEPDGKYMLRNVNGGTFYLEPLAKTVIFYKTASKNFLFPEV
jgi:hypothetical protein